jgi:hypothetical protein
MNAKPASCLSNENGSALIVAMLILIVVTILGIMASRSANIELQIASHDKVAKMTRYATETVCEGLAPELIEQQIDGLPSSSSTTSPAPTLVIFEPNFFLDEVCKVPSETDRDFQAGRLSETTVHVSVFGMTSLTEGNAIQLPEGYHGRGKGLAGGGAQIRFVIRGLGRGAADSEARVSTGWRHVI